MAAWMRWRLPLLLDGGMSRPDGGADASDADVDREYEEYLGERDPVAERKAAAEQSRAAAERAVHAVQHEAAWLGLAGAGALGPPGAAALAGADVAASIGDALGVAQRTARLQTDLTAVVLGSPDAELAAALDAMADREGQSSATTWRFSPSSIRRALDAGADEAELLASLTRLAQGAVPQALAYTVRDAARRHGLLRGGSVACYLRSDDPALLSELLADRRLRRLGLRHLAPTVVAGVLPLEETLQAIRAAGHSPVEEQLDGTAVVASRPRHRVAPTVPVGRPPRASGAPAPAARASAEPHRRGGSAARRSTPASRDPAEVARALLAAGDHPPGRLLELPGGVMDMTLFEDYQAEQLG
jgi:hypothetical protein